jgi:hypothetical protein
MTTPHIHTDYANSSIYRPLIKVAGKSGVLTGLGVAGGTSYHYFRIIIDGKIIVDEFLCASLPQNFGNNGLGVNLPFERELAVEIRDSIPSPLPRFWCSYIISGSKLVKETYDIRKIEEATYVYKVELLEWEGKQYTIESSYGNEKISEVSLEKDVYSPGDRVKGVIKLRNWKGEKLKEENVFLILRLVGRSTILEKFRIGYVDGEEKFEFISPKFQGQFEVMCNLIGYANFPAIFTVI